MPEPSLPPSVQTAGTALFVLELAAMDDRIGWDIAPSDDQPAGFDRQAAADALAAGQTVTVIWARPAALIAADLRLGQSPAPALARWQAQVAELLALFRRNRRKMVLVQQPDLVEAEDTPDLIALAACNAETRLPELRAALEELEASSTLATTTTLNLYTLDRLAVDLADRQAKVQRMVTEQAGAIALLQDQIALADKLHHALLAAEVEAHAKARQSLPSFDEVDALRQQIRQLTQLAGEVSALRAQIAEQENHLAEATALNERQAVTLMLLREGQDLHLTESATAEAAARAHIASLETALADQQEASMATIADMTASLTALQTETAQLRVQESALTIALQAESAARQSLYQSSSWKLTAPLRQLRKLASH